MVFMTKTRRFKCNCKTIWPIAIYLGTVVKGWFDPIDRTVKILK